MRCPFCGTEDTAVVDTRINDDGDSVRRRRRCAQCDKRFTTYERAEIQLPQVVKKNGSRTDYQRAKLKASMMLALRKRPVETDALEQALDGIEDQLRLLGVREVPSPKIGEMVMSALKRLDNVAYIRFASVYRNFEDVADFSLAVKEVTRAPRGPRASGRGESK
jgi:transcriptional repressor NrdR